MTNQISKKLLVAQTKEGSLIEQMNAIRIQLAAASAEVSTLKWALDAAQLQEEQEKKPKKRKSTASNDWKRVFAILIKSHPKPFGYEDIGRAANSLGIDIQDTSMRAKMSKYAKDGYIERKSSGQFIVSARGQSFFDLITDKYVEKRMPDDTFEEDPVIVSSRAGIAIARLREDEENREKLQNLGENIRKRLSEDR